MAESLLDFVKDQQKAFRGLEAFGPRLSNLTRHAIEIQQEDHGKAILVFTIVTIVFLPLSFVTSLLGMNTKDIRNLNNTQWLFWAISIPLTIVTMLVALVIGYKGDAIREKVRNFVRQPVSGPPIAKRHDQMTPKRKVNFTASLSDVEAFPSSKEKNMPPASYARSTTEIDKYMPMRSKQRKADREVITITEHIYPDRGRSRSPPPYVEYDRYSDRSSSRGSLSSFPRSRSGYRTVDPAIYTGDRSRDLTRYRARSRERARSAPLVKRDSYLTRRSLSKGTRRGSHYYDGDDRSDTGRTTSGALVPYRRRGERSSSPTRRRPYSSREIHSRKSTIDSLPRRSSGDTSARRLASPDSAVGERSPPRRQSTTVSPSSFSPPPTRSRNEGTVREEIVIVREDSPPRPIPRSAFQSSPPPPVPPVERTREREEIVTRVRDRSPRRGPVRSSSPSTSPPRRRYTRERSPVEREEIIIRRRGDDYDTFDRRPSRRNRSYDPSVYHMPTPSRRRSTYYDDDNDSGEDDYYRSRRRRSTYDEDDYSYRPRERPRPRRRSTRYDDYDVIVPLPRERRRPPPRHRSSTYYYDDDSDAPRRRRSIRYDDYDDRYRRSRERRATSGIPRRTVSELATSGLSALRDREERERRLARDSRMQEHERLRRLAEAGLGYRR